MDLDRFLSELPGLYEHWGKQGCRPRSRAFDGVLSSVRGMTTPAILQLLNHAVACLGSRETYCEIGCFHGSTLIGALLNQPQARAEAVDDFSEFDPGGDNHRALSANLARFGLSHQVRFSNRDFEPFFQDRRRSIEPPIGVYLYDGAHDYRSQMMGLLLAVPHLADRAAIVIDDANWPAVRQATWDFLAAFPAARLVLDVQTPGNCSPDWWNGLHLLAWGRAEVGGTKQEELARRREASLLESLTLLQEVGLRREGGAILVDRPR